MRMRMKSTLCNSDRRVHHVNRALKSIKSDTFVDFIYKNYQGLIITTNKMFSLSDINIVENYIKNVYTIYTSNIQTA